MLSLEVTEGCLLAVYQEKGDSYVQIDRVN